MASERNELIWGEVVARAWRDEAYKEQLLANPKQVLIEAGASIPEDLEIRIVSNTEGVRYLVLPPAPTTRTGQPLSEEALDLVAGGSSEATSTNTTQTAEAETTEVEATETTTTVAAEAEVTIVVVLI